MSTIRSRLVDELNELHKLKREVSDYQDYERIVKIIIIKERQLSELVSKQINSSIPEYETALDAAKKAATASKSAQRNIQKINQYLAKATTAVEALAMLLRLF